MPVIARRRSESMFILQTAICDAFFNISSGIPTASGILPPFSFIISTNFGTTEDAPCKTMGNFGNLASTSCNMSNLNWGFCPGLNLYAPWLVPIAMANESTPVRVTKSSTCPGSVYEALSSVTWTSSSMPASRPNSASTVTLRGCA